ncbi:MAG: hypothetical protein V2B14_00485 [bacterium]
MKKLKKLFIISGLFIIFLKYYNVEKFEKSKLGGIVVNNSSHEINIKENRVIKTLPPGKSSRDMKIFDVDFIIIKKPTIFENKKYSDGALKICDFSSIKIDSKDGSDKFIPSFSYKFCKIFSDVGWYKIIPD